MAEALTKAEQAVNELLDFAMVHPEGFTLPEFSQESGIALPQIGHAVHDLRDQLEDGALQLVCRPNGPCSPWTYSLTDAAEDVALWTRSRTRDMTSRVRTMRVVA